jgi:hypothetical protein
LGSLCMWNPGRAVILSDYYKNRTIIKVIFPRSYKWELNTPIKRCQKAALCQPATMAATVLPIGSISSI